MTWLGRRWGWIAAGIAALVVLVVWRMNAARPPEVAVLTVAEAPLTRVLALVGRVRPAETVSVRAEAAGTAVRLLADEGDRVRAGQTLAVIEAAEEDAAVARAQADAAQRLADAAGRSADIAAREAAAAEARRALTRTETLAAQGFASDAALTEARTRAASAEAALRAARSARAAAEAAARAAQASLAIARTQAVRTAVRSPRDAIVLTRPIDPGQVIDLQTVLFTLGSADAVEIEAEADETFADALRVGMPAVVSPSGAGAVIGARVSEIAPQIDPRSGGRLIRLRTEAGDPLPPGRTIDVNVIVDRTARAIAVPRAAILDPGGSAAVLRVGADGVVARVGVRFLDWPSAEVRVLSGLAPGDRIVRDPAGVAPGTRVRPVDATPPAAGPGGAR